MKIHYGKNQINENEMYLCNKCHVSYWRGFHGRHR